MQSILSPKKYIQTKARALPIYKCYINSEWQPSGLANITVSRKQPSGNFVVGVYLVDLYASGLKDTFYLFNQTLTSLNELIESGKKEFGTTSCSYELVHNIIYEGIAYAEELGIKPAKEFEITKYIIEEDTEAIDQMEIECGRDGKPCVVVYPDDSKTKLISHLEQKVGAGNFAMVMMGNGLIE